MRFIKSQLSKLIILLLLKPEWLARTENSPFRSNIKNRETIKKHLIIILENTKKYKILNKIEIGFSGFYKNNQNINLIKKINGNRTISKRLCFLLNNQEIISQNLKSNIFIKKIRDFNELYQFFSIIYYIGLEWHLYTNLQKNNLYLNFCFINENNKVLCLSSLSILNKILIYISKFINNQSANLQSVKCYLWDNHQQYLDFANIEIQIQQPLGYSLMPSNKSLKSIIKSMRSKLYHRNEKGFWRLNNQVAINEILLFTNYLLQSWDSYYFNIERKLYKKRIKQTIDRILYLWQRKKQRD